MGSFFPTTESGRLRVLAFVQEEKTLYVTVLSAQGLAGNDRSLLIQHCDPFFQLKCNGKVQHTSTKHNTREPK